MKNMEKQLTEKGSGTRKVKMNKMTMRIGILLVLIGAACFAAKAFTGSYVDSQGYLHEAFALLPLGYMFVFSGVIIMAVTGISFGVKAHHC